MLPSPPHPTPNGPSPEPDDNAAVPHARDTSHVDLSGPWAACRVETGLARAFAEPGFDDASWATVVVPGHWRSHPEFATWDGAVAYRRRFETDTLAAGRRRFVTFEGAFYFGDMWLDGAYLGATEGYFAPHTFEISDRAGREHVLAAEVACPPQTDRAHKRTVTGVFSHWDNLDPTWNPGGLWRPVSAHETGPVRITRLRVLCTEAGDTHGRLLVDVGLDPGGTPLDGDARLEAHVAGPDGAPLATATRDVRLAAGPNRITWTIDVDHPPRWWPWRLGDQPLCTVDVSVGVRGETSDSRERRTAFREVRMRDWTFTVNGERLFLAGSNLGPTRMALGEAMAAELTRDVALARAAHLDLLRIHAHVSRPELYDAADRLGVLLWQDLPLQWGYARAVRKPAVRQAREMVDLLGHHPSVALWCAHNEPLALDTPTGEAPSARKIARLGASMFLPSWNKDVLDRSVAHTLRRSDPTRPVDAHSGVLPGVGSAGTDTHWYFGWYHGTLDGLPRMLGAFPRAGRFVSELGAQAVPSTDSFLAPERWPDLDWRRLSERHSLQLRYFDRYVPPTMFDAFHAWRDATQSYQAALVQLQVEDLRRVAHRPTGGFCHFCFADGHAAISWSVLDHERVPKDGYGALRDACRTVLPMWDPRTGHVHVSNLGPQSWPGARVEVTVDGRGHTFEGDVGPGSVTFVGTVSSAPDGNGPAEGDGLAESAGVVLTHPEHPSVRNDYGRVLEWLRITRPQGRPRSRITRA